MEHNGRTVVRGITKGGVTLSFQWITESKLFSFTNLHNQVNADKLFVCLLLEIERQGFDPYGKILIADIPKLIPRGTGGISNHAVYGFSVLSMLSGQKGRNYFIFDVQGLREELTTVANNNYNRDNYQWLKQYPQVSIRINPIYIKA